MESLVKKKFKNTKFDKNKDLPLKPSEEFKDKSRRVIELGSLSDDNSKKN